MTHKKWIPIAMVIADKHAKSDSFDGTGYTRCTLEIARALMAADKAATECERERCAKIAETYSIGAAFWPHRIAVAIRKGTPHD